MRASKNCILYIDKIQLLYYINIYLLEWQAWSVIYSHLSDYKSESRMDTFWKPLLVNTSA